jgi:hypothetical protein
VAGLVVSAAVVSGELILGLSDGQIIRAGYVQGSQGLQGPMGPIGATGKPGLDGNGMLHGPSFPKPDEGRDGDFFYCTAKKAIFGPKQGGVWGKPVYLSPDDWGETQLGKPVSTSGRRFFSSAIGGGATGAPPVPTSGTGSLTPILNNETALAAATQLLVAQDIQGDAMVVDLWAQAAQGTLFVEVAVSKGNGTDTGYSVVYEIQMGTQPPVLSFTPGVTGTGGLQLSVSSDIALTTLRGRVMYL